MTRLVVPKSVGGAPFALGGAPPDQYQDRLVKYLPAESIALYTLTDKMLFATAKPETWLYSYGPWLLFLLGLVGTPLYLWKQRKPDQPWKMHAIIGTVAFALWAYTLGGTLFVWHDKYDPLLASLLAPIFTFVAGLFEPN